MKVTVKVTTVGGWGKKYLYKSINNILAHALAPLGYLESELNVKKKDDL